MSGFANESDIDQWKFDWAKPVETSGHTCECFVVQIDGKRFFQKKLRHKYIRNLSFRAMFRKEYEKGISLSHPNVVKYESLYDTDDGCYILMENIVGETLDEFIEHHPDYFGSRAHLDKFFNQLLGALKCLHESHVVHSDLKPQNIIITQVNNDVKLIDLGFCFTDSYPVSTGTTAGYSAPEHINKSKVDVLTDIYGVGKIIEYIGRNSARNMPSIYAKIMLQCLKEQPSNRIQSTDEIVTLINRRNHTIRQLAIGIVAGVAIFLAYKTITYNEVFNAWWDSFEIITPTTDYDVEYYHTYYNILSEEEKTCVAVGHSKTPNVYLTSTVVIHNKKYRLTHIADSAFAQKKYLKSIHIPEGVLSIGIESFRGCENLTSISLPNSIKSIDNYAFHGCNGVEYLKLSSSITTIKCGSFTGCNITHVVIPDGVRKIELDAFGNCGKLEDVTLPQSLETLERGVFWNCGSLKQISIPHNVTTMGEYLFFHCSNLTDIYNYATVPQDIPPIHHNLSQITLHVPAESVEAYQKAHYWREMNVVAMEVE